LHAEFSVSIFTLFFHTRNVSDSPSVNAKNPQQTPVYSEIYGSSRMAVVALGVFEFAAYRCAAAENFCFGSRVRIRGKFKVSAPGHSDSGIAMATFTTLLRRDKPKGLYKPATPLGG